VNLKQAARKLGVHYQTAYRWVRSGELAAIKVGNRYVVSEGAIEHFRRRRDSLQSAPSSPPPLEPGPVDADRTALADLTLASETRATARPCFEAAAALAATQVGDAALVRLLDETGEWLDPVASHAADPQLRAIVAGAVEVAGSFPRETPHWAAAEFSGDVHVVHHMPQDLVITSWATMVVSQHAACASWRAP
jgi:excisionase family DNA binding protein